MFVHQEPVADAGQTEWHKDKRHGRKGKSEQQLATMNRSDSRWLETVTKLSAPASEAPAIQEYLEDFKAALSSATE